MSITFDGENKLAILSTGTTSLSVSELWSRWVDWVVIDDNSKYPIALSQIGGDEIGGGRYLGLTFFLENGWRIRPFEGDHTLVITGNIFTRDGSPPTAPTIGTYNVTVNLSTSNLVDAISTSGSTPETIATEVWNRLTTANDEPGSFGQFMTLIKNATDTITTKVDQLDAKMDGATVLIQTLVKYQSNRTKIDQVEKTLTVYDDDGTTPIKVFDLKNFNGDNSIVQIAERDPR